jgi:heme-degrading monooxygenase HmoA
MAPDLPVICIFRSTRTDHSEEEYAIWSQEMDELVVEVPGYQHHYSFRDPVTREGVTVAYFDDLDAIARWRSNPRHREAQEFGRLAFYEEYSLEVAQVVRQYQWERTT